jgi:hypothetical protein
MKRLLLLIGVLLCASAARATTYYIDYTGGSNSNAGTSTGAAWKSAPGMQTGAGCGSATHAYTHSAGDRFIFKGGVTWPAACFGLSISNGGSGSGTQDYWGVDLSWFTGGSFTRPIFDLANTLSIGGAPITVRAQWITFDNIEVKRTKLPSVASGNCTDANMDLGGGSGNITVKNMYIHDWTTAALGAGTTSHASGSICQNGAAGPINADSDELSDAATTAAIPFGACFRNLTEIKNSKCHDTGEGEVGHFGPIHGNEFYNINGVAVQGYDSANHTNIIETSKTGPTDSPIYNNLIHDTNAGVTIFDCMGATIFRNIMWNNANFSIMLDSNCPGVNSSTTANIYDNTVDCHTGAGCFRVFYRTGGTPGILNLKNNHWITNGAPTCYNNVGGGCENIAGGSQSNNVTMSTSTATAQGYTSANNYSPTALSNGTVGVGANLTSLCSGALAPLCVDINGNTAPSSGAWDVGSYQFLSSSLTVTPNPVAFGNQNTGTQSGASTATVTNSGPTSVTLGSINFYSITGTNPSEFPRFGGTCTTAYVLAPAATCTITVKFSPAAAGSRTARLNVLGTGSGSTDLTGTGVVPGGLGGGTLNLLDLSREVKNVLPVVNGGTGLSVAASADVVASPRKCSAASASGTAYTCSTSPSFTPAAKDEILFQADVASTGSATLNVNSSSAATIKKQGGGTNLVANDLLAGQWVSLIYDGAFWQMQGQTGNASAGGVSSYSGDGALISNSSSTGAVATTLAQQNPNLVFSSAASASNTNVVQTATGTIIGATSGTAVFSSSVAAGHAIAVHIQTYIPIAAVSPVVDTQGNAYTQGAHWLTGTDDYVYYTCNAAGGADTITVTLNSSSYAGIIAADISGNATTSCFDQSGTGATNFASSFSVTTGGSVAQAKELVIGVAAVSNSPNNSTYVRSQGAFTDQRTLTYTASGNNTVLTMATGNSTTGLSGTQSVTFNADGSGGYYQVGIFTIKLNTTGTSTPAFHDLTQHSGLNYLPSGLPIVYDKTGAIQGLPHSVVFSGTLSSGTLAITLAGNAVFTSSSSYSCTVSDSTTGTNAIGVTTYTSGSAFTVTGTGSDTFRGYCAGN